MAAGKLLITRRKKKKKVVACTQNIWYNDIYNNNSN